MSVANILIVEDEENIRKMVTLTLTHAGHHVQTAASGTEGIQLYGDGRGINIVLLDHRLGDSEGTAILRRLREIDPDIWAIMMTAVGTVSLAEEAREAGAMDLIRKPFSAELLRAVVDRALNGERPLQQPRTVYETRLQDGFSIADYSEPEKSGWTKFWERLKERGDKQTIRRILTVTNPTGEAQDCVVVLSEDYLRETRETVGEENTHRPRFWEALTVEALADYVSEHHDFPPLQTLTLAHLPETQQRSLRNVAGKR